MVCPQEGTSIEQGETEVELNKRYECDKYVKRKGEGEGREGVGPKIGRC